MKVNRDRILILLSIFGIILGLGLCLFHLHRLKEKKGSIHIRVEKVDPNSSVNHKLENTYISGTWQNCTLGNVLFELCDRAGVELSFKTDVAYSDIWQTMVSDRVDHKPLKEVLIRIFKHHKLRCFVSSDGICVKGPNSGAGRYSMPNGEMEWEVELIPENSKSGD